MRQNVNIAPQTQPGSMDLLHAVCWAANRVQQTQYVFTSEIRFSEQNLTIVDKENKMLNATPTMIPENSSSHSAAPTSPTTAKKELRWEELVSEQQLTKTPTLRRFLSFLSATAKVESLIYSLSTGAIAGSFIILLLSYFPPLALVIVSSISIGALSGGLLWSRWAKEAKAYQKFLILLAALLISGLFILIINFAAIPTLGVTAALAGSGFLIAAANAALYLTIAMGILQLLISSISTWKTNHQQASASLLKNAHSLAKGLRLRRLTELGSSYSFTEKIFLSYGFFIASGLGLAAGALSYYGIVQLLPLALTSLALGLSLSSSIIVPLAIGVFIVSTLVISKQLMSHFIARAEANREERLKSDYIPSLLESLLNKNAGLSFGLKIQRNIRAVWHAIFSFERYQQYHQQYHPSQIHLSRAEFRTRNLLSLTLLLPFTLIATLITPLLSQAYRHALKEKLANTLFWKNPLRYSLDFIKFNASYFFSYQGYKTRHPETILTASQFYWRNVLAFILIPLIITAISINLYTQTLGSMLLVNVFHQSEAAAILISNLVNAFLAAFVSPMLLAVLHVFNPIAPLATNNHITETQITNPQLANESSTASSSDTAPAVGSPAPRPRASAAPLPHHYTFTPSDPLPASGAASALKK